MGLSALLIGAALLGMEGFPLSGTVEDRAGKPVAGAEVWLADRPRGSGPKVLAHATTDDRGRFQLDRPADATGDGPLWPMGLWAFRRGYHVGLKAFPNALPGPDQPLRLVLGPAARTTVTVELPDRASPTGAKVRVTVLHRRPVLMPAELAEKVAATVAGDGRATIEAFEPEEIGFVEVEADGLGVQRRSFFPPSPADKTVWLRPAGRVEGRIVADDPKALAGWSVEAYTRPDDEATEPGATAVGGADTTTDDRGRFTIPAIASGRLTVEARPPEGVPYLALPPAEVVLRGGATATVEIKAARAVRVEGVVREKGSGKPIAGAQVGVLPIGHAGMVPMHPADAEGRFHSLALPGKVSIHISDVPDDYIPALGLYRNGVAIPEGVDRLALDPFEAMRGATVAGSVVDDRGAPVAGATVRGLWDSKAPAIIGATVATTDATGRFVLRGIVDGVKVEVAARTRDMATHGTVAAKAGDGREVALKLSRADLFALRGRIVGRDGKPLAGAVVQVEYKETQRYTASMSAVLFDDDTPIRTWEDGTFTTPRELTRDREYRIKANAVGREPGETTYLKPGAGDVVTLPDLVLRRAPKLRAIAGRVVNPGGKPLAGVVVFQTGDGPRRTQATTDEFGRFRVGGVDAGAAFLLVDDPRYHPLVRLVRPNEGQVELALLPIGAKPAKGLTTLPSRLSRREERAIAMGLLEPILPAALEAEEFGNLARWYALMALAAGDPDRFVAEFRARPRSEAYYFFARMALGLVDDDPAAALAVIEKDTVPIVAIGTALEVVDTLPPSEEKLRRDVLKAAAKRVQELPRNSDRVSSLAKIADRLFDLGDRAAAEPLAKEAREAAANLREREIISCRVELAEALARVDLPAALKLLEDFRTDNHGLAVARGGIARRIAATDPELAERLIDQVRDVQEYERKDILLRVAVAMAPKDLARARRLVDRIPADVFNPASYRARALGLMARSLADSDPAGARALLAEAFDRLGRPRGVDPGPDRDWDANIVMAALLPVAERLDPALVPDYLARTLARRPARPETLPHSDLDTLANLAALVARYDREAGLALLAPVADQLPDLLAGRPPGIYHAHIRRLLQDAALVDPRRAAELAARLPRKDDRPEDYRFEARLAAAQSIALPLAVRRRVAMSEILSGWSKDLGD